MRILFVALLLIGCAGGPTPQQSLEGLDTASRDPKCIRGCTETYSSCVADTSVAAAVNWMMAKNLREACGGALRICAETCPKR